MAHSSGPKLCRQCNMNEVLRVMRGGRWYTLEELGKHVKPRRALVDALRSLGYNHMVVGVRVPGMGERRLWHRYVPAINKANAPNGLINVFAIPWWMKETYTKKIARLQREGVVRAKLPGWLRAEMIVERYLIRTGLHYARRRQSMGFWCSCAWRVNPERYPRTASKTDGMYTFGVDFTARVKTTTSLPPFDKKPILGFLDWLGDDRYKYEMWIDSNGTRITIANTAEFSANPETGLIAGPTPEQLAEQTSARIMKGVARSPAMVIFLSTKGMFELLSKRPKVMPP